MWESAEFGSCLRSFVFEEIGPIDRIEPVRMRPWSAVWLVQVAGRSAYVKQNCPGQAHEAGLLARLAMLTPEHVVPVLGADAFRDLLLTDDLGPTVRDRGLGADIGVWERIVSEAAVLQRKSLGIAGSLGLTCLAPGDATTYVADAVGRLSALQPDDPRRLGPATAADLERLLPTIGGWSDEVEDLDLPLALVHNDLHDANLAIAEDGTLRFFDFADAVLADPLCALSTPLDVAALQCGLGPGDPALWRIADAFLDVWSDLAPISALRRALPAALRLGRLARVESWRRCVASMTPAERTEFGAAPAAHLTALLDPPLLGEFA